MKIKILNENEQVIEEYDNVILSWIEYQPHNGKSYWIFIKQLGPKKLFATKYNPKKEVVMYSER